MTKSRWIIFSVICVAILGVLVFTSSQDDAKFSGDANKIESTGDFKDHVYGSKSNKVVLIEYGDFQCGGCGGMFPIVKMLKEKYKEDLTFVYRNFPLTSFHPNALAAATVAEAAGKQGKFFEMHDKLFQDQKLWQDASIDNRDKQFQGYARELGLDIKTYTRSLTDANINKKINRDRSIGKSAGVTSTPTFFLQGKKLEQNVWGATASFEKAVQEAITKATGKKFTEAEAKTPTAE